MERSVAGLGFSVLFAVAGCGASHTAAWEVKSASNAPAATGDAAALVKEGDDAWAKRDDRAELEKAIAAWEKAAAIAPDGDTYSKLTHGVYLLADGHLFFEASSSPAAQDKSPTSLKRYTAAVGKPTPAASFATSCSPQKTRTGSSTWPGRRHRSPSRATPTCGGS